MYKILFGGIIGYSVYHLYHLYKRYKRTKKVKAHNDMVYHISQRIIFVDNNTLSEKMIELGISRGKEYFRVIDMEEYVEIPSVRILDHIRIHNIHNQHNHNENELFYKCESDYYIYFGFSNNKSYIKIKIEDENIYDGYFYLDRFSKLSLPCSSNIDQLSSFLE